MTLETGCAFVAALLLCGGAARAADPLEQRVVEEVSAHVQRERSTLGLPGLAPRSELDAAARQQAREIAALPATERLSRIRPIDLVLDEHGLERYELAVQHVDLKRGYADPAAAFIDGWTKHRGDWDRAMSSEMDSMGVGCAIAADGYVVLVAVLVDAFDREHDAAQIERATVEAINRERAAFGVGPLELDRRLSEAAREHSLDMSQKGYFAHASPQGAAPSERARELGARFDRVSVNIQMNNDPENPVGVAVESWMNSPDHRKVVLDPDYSQTGVGVAVDAARTVWFTQIFSRPSAENEPGP